MVNIAHHKANAKMLLLMLLPEQAMEPTTDREGERERDAAPVLPQIWRRKRGREGMFRMS